MTHLIDAGELKKVLSEPLYRSTIKDYGEILKYTFVMDIIDNAPTVEPNKELIIKFEKEIEYLQEAQYDLDDEGGAVYSSLQREIEMYESIIKTLRGEKK